VLVLQAADRAGRDDALHAEHLEAVDVGAEVQLGRQQAMAGAVPSEERNAAAAQRAEDIRPRWVSEWRCNGALFTVGQLGQVVQSAAADDADAGHWSLVVGRWSLVVGRWQLTDQCEVA